ncbi:MAG: hypothetical protein FD180_2447 [Planctomycetota bacterium]|nr:MAG: hypothetical protein FD180_2447 [Planctomycetota bacterium]
MRRPTALFLAFSFAAPAFADDGPLVGKPLPGIAISHPLQGEAWMPADLKGQIVVLDLFQLG